MEWLRIAFIVLNLMMIFAGLFTSDDHGKLEITNLLRFHAVASDSPDVALVDAATPALALWQLVGVCFVIWLRLSAWHLLWWFLLGAVLATSIGKWLILKIYS